MKSGSQKFKLSGNCVQDRGKDRLSELPDEVIVHILSFLPTLDAVRTVLLRRFGSLWTWVTTLDFWDYDFILTSDEADYTALESRFALFVRNVLILHKRPTIDDFLLCVDDEMDWDRSYAYNAIAEVEMGIRFALSRDVKALTLHFRPYDQDYFPLPACIYTSHSLVMLKLSDCKIDVPRRVHMGSLRTLDISCFLVDDKFNEFVVGCPALKELAIAHTYDIQVLRSSSIEKLEFIDVNGEGPCTIDCPNLKSLDIRVDLDYVGVVNAPSVREVTVSCCNCLSDENVLRFKRFLEGFQSAEVMNFDGAVDEDFTYFLKVNVGFPENRWKRVILDSSMHVACIAGLYSLVRNSPYLEELTIKAVECSPRALMEIGRKLVSREASTPCVVPCLKVVSMHGYGKPYEGQLQFAEFLLKSAVDLDKLKIFSNGRNKLTSAEELLFVQRLSKFPRASPNAMIVFQ